MFPIVPIESCQSYSSNSKPYYDNAMRYQNENKQHLVNEPQTQQDFWTFNNKGSQEKIDDEIFLTLNDFKRPHSAFQIDNPPDENISLNNGITNKNNQFVYSTEVPPLQLIKHGNDMNIINKINNYDTRNENSPDILQMKHINVSFNVTIFLNLIVLHY